MAPKFHQPKKGSRRKPAATDGKAASGAKAGGKPKGDGTVGAARSRTAAGGKNATYGTGPKSGSAARTGTGPKSGSAARTGTGPKAANPGSYLNNCRQRALAVKTRRELGQQPRDVLAQLAIAHPVKTMRLGAIRQLTAGDNPRDVAALRQVERSVEAGPEVRAAASRGAEIVQHRVDDL
jgi:hypothetical protein